jgi:hypothetical protein
MKGGTSLKLNFRTSLRLKDETSLMFS